MNAREYDMVIAGAGPAGAAAAIKLARAGKRVALVDRAGFPRAATGAGWLNLKARPLLDELKAPLEDVLAHPFQQVTFHNAELTKSSSPRLKDSIGFLVDRTRFDNALVDAAQQAGAALHVGHEISAIEPLEDRVVVHRGEAEAVVGRFLLLAAGRGTPWLDRLKFSRSPASRPVWMGTAFTGDGAADEGSVGVVLGLDREGSFALLVRSPAGCGVTLNWSGDKPQVRPMFVQLCRKLFEKQLFPVDLSAPAASAEITFSPASFALEMDTHVSKNALVAGDAGGFVAALSHEGLYPAMWSARIAADVLLEASAAPRPQDVLMTYETRWRAEMAAYLSPPNTDMHYLLPMIFSNPAMADRMALAFFAGENL